MLVHELTVFFQLDRFLSWFVFFLMDHKANHFIDLLTQRLIVRCAAWLFLLPMKGLSLDWHNDQLTDWFNIWLAVTINRFRTYWKLMFDWTYTRLIEWLAHWLTDFITDWLIDQLTVWMTDKPFDWLTDWLINQLTVWMTDKPTDWLTDSLINQLTVWMTDKPIESITYLWNRSCIW